MNRRRILIGASTAALLLCGPARAQKARAHGISRVGALMWEPETSQSDRYRARLAGLMESLGHAGDTRIDWQWRYAGRVIDRLPVHAAELVSTRPDAFVAPNSLTVRAAAQATTSIPIVGVVGNPFKEGYTHAIGRPVANVTGISGAYQEVVHKMMEHLKLVMPGIARFGIVAPAGLSITAEFVEYHEEAARSVGIAPVTTLVTSRGEAERAFLAMRGLGIPAAFTPFSAGFFPDKESIARLALESRVAVVDVSPGLATAGGLLTFSGVMDYTRTLAEQLDRVLRGTPVREIPFQQPTKFRLVVNRKTATALGISLPAEVLLRADTVIE